MKEKDLDKSLEAIIIEGLIKEAEQENADFEAAMRKMSDEDFNQLIQSVAINNRLVQSAAVNKSKWKVFRPWISSAVAAAAVILIVLIPSINNMNDKLCESALYASQSYMTQSKGGFDVSAASTDQIKEKLPELRRKYDECLNEIERSRAHYSPDLQETGWDLTMAYLKLHKKGDAVKVLKVMSEQFDGTPFGNHCQKMLDQL